MPLYKIGERGQANSAHSSCATLLPRQQGVPRHVLAFACASLKCNFENFKQTRRDLEAIACNISHVPLIFRIPFKANCFNTVLALNENEH
ncbi:hypothetical protein OUZ56_022109 [Daphnia magna]|uniref:Uncharacterized protein n=1 Tax=Daphnia magna TaxID=35525 RepID=A0ABR0AVN3_9CRUS|nr:hypothetical protein OUZ56_022109 [Daphnia magna]